MTQLPISRPAAVVAAVATTAGLLTGVAWYVNRSDVVEAQVPGTEAWLAHIIVGVVVVAWFVFAARRSPFGARVVLSPLGRPIASRISATFRSSRNPLRWIAVGFLVFVEVYSCWRIGEQVFAGLDPNFVRNAWGGPSYLGAMFCHYLDAALILSVCHTLLRVATVSADESADRKHQHA